VIGKKEEMKFVVQARRLNIGDKLHFPPLHPLQNSICDTELLVKVEVEVN